MNPLFQYLLECPGLLSDFEFVVLEDSLVWAQKNGIKIETKKDIISNAAAFLQYKYGVDT